MLQVSVHSSRVPYGLWTQNGLLDEVRELTCQALSSNDGNTDNSAISLMNFTFGVFQSIGKFNGLKWTQPMIRLVKGFREFHRYLTDPSPSELKYRAAIQNLKTANYQYAKRQVSWIRNKLLPAIRASKSTKGTKAMEMYLLDATGPYFIDVCLKWGNGRFSLCTYTEPQKWSSGVKDVANNLMEGQSNRLSSVKIAESMIGRPLP